MGFLIRETIKPKERAITKPINNRIQKPHNGVGKRKLLEIELHNLKEEQKEFQYYLKCIEYDISEIEQKFNNFNK